MNCKNCGYEITETDLCRTCNNRVQALINTHPQIFQEDVFDKINPKSQKYYEKTLKKNSWWNNI
jgi:hypothetical protein